MSDDTTAAVNPRYRRYIRRLEQLVDRGVTLDDEQNFSTTSTRTNFPGGAARASHQKFRDGTSYRDYTQWKVQCQNLLRDVFGEDSEYYRWFDGIGKRRFSRSKVGDHLAVVVGALEDLRGGFLIGQEFIVAGAVFDDVLQEAKHLQQAGHKDAAAVLGRTVLEDALRRLARSAEVDDTGQVSGVNDRLKEAGLLTQPRWRGVRTMLDVGNAAAHGEFDQYDHGDVAKMLDDIEAFLATEFHA